MSKEYVSFLVIILATILPKIGVEIANDALTTFVFVTATIIAGIVGAVARYSKGDISVLGKRK